MTTDTSDWPQDARRILERLRGKVVSGWFPASEDLANLVARLCPDPDAHALLEEIALDPCLDGECSHELDEECIDSLRGHFDGSRGEPARQPCDEGAPGSTPHVQASTQALVSPVVYIAPDCPTCGARDGNAHRDRACLDPEPQEPDEPDWCAVLRRLRPLERSHGVGEETIDAIESRLREATSELIDTRQELAEARAEVKRLRTDCEHRKILYDLLKRHISEPEIVSHMGLELKGRRHRASDARSDREDEHPSAGAVADIASNAANPNDEERTESE